MTERRLLERALAVAVFVVVYVLMWRPLRVWIAQELVVGLLNAIGPVLDFSYAFASFGHSPIVSASPLFDVGLQDSVRQWRMPGGMFFLLGGGLLVAYAPRRLHWLAFLGFSLVLGCMSFVAFLVGLRGATTGFEIQLFIDVYLIRPLSLGIPLLVIFRPFDRIA